MNHYVIVGAFVAGLASGGYSMNFYWTAKDDARMVAEAEAREQADKVQIEMAHNAAKLLQESRANVKTNTVYRTKYVERPINSVACTDNDGLQLIKSYSTNNARKLTSDVPNGVAKP